MYLIVASLLHTVYDICFVFKFKKYIDGIDVFQSRITLNVCELPFYISI